MADYACTVTLDTPSAKKFNKSFHLITGIADITNYNTTGAEITDITGEFITLLRVIAEALSDNGYLVRWDTTDNCFHAFYPTAAQSATLAITDNDNAASAGVALYFDEDGTAGQRVQFVSPTNADGSDTNVSVAAAAGSEVANDVDVGIVNFIAIGLV